MPSVVLMRSTVHPSRHTWNHKRRHNPKSLALVSLAGILFVFGMGVGIMQLRTNHQVKAQVKTLAAQTAVTTDGSLPDGALPSEDPPKNSYAVAPTAPQSISIPKIGVQAGVLKLGVMANNQIKTPANIHEAGWFSGSAKPGEQGAVFINGHVHGPTMPGVFANLKKLRAGDKIRITRGDGKVFSYSVVKSQSYDKDDVDMGAAFNTAVPGKPGLNLMTCDGAYDEEGHYNQRLIVFAVQD